MAYSFEFAWVGSTGEHSMKTGPQYEAAWRVFTDNPFDQSQKVIQWFRDNVQDLGTEYTYANDTNGSIAYSKRIAARRELGTTNIWIVTVTYEPIDANNNDPGRDMAGDPTDNPLDFRPKVHIRTTRYTRATERARYLTGYTGTAAARMANVDFDVIPCNSTLVQPFNPGLEEDEIRTLVMITRNLATFDATISTTRVDTINSHAFQLNWFGLKLRCIARDAKLCDFEVPALERLNGVDYWPVSWGFEVKQGGWIDEIVDRGFAARAEAGDPDGRGGTLSNGDIIPGVPALRQFVDFDEMPLSDPVLLNGDGQPNDPTAPPVYISFIKFDEYNILELDFFNGILQPM